MPSFRMHRARAHRSGNGIYLLSVYYSARVKAKEFSDFPCRCGHFLPNVRAKQGRGNLPRPCAVIHFLQAAPAGPYFRLPRSSTVMVVVFGIAVMSLETLTVPSNMAFTSAL